MKQVIPFSEPLTTDPRCIIVELTPIRGTGVSGEITVNRVNNHRTVVSTMRAPIEWNTALSALLAIVRNADMAPALLLIEQTSVRQLDPTKPVIKFTLDNCFDVNWTMARFIKIFSEDLCPSQVA